ncbi:hypothetical protein SMC68_004237 [Cronobacter sakazakii]|nr:hypothetical protein [Cronobacter sakazakii]ELY2905583.1 hypothetical protein [Cronobacter sakazakii]ELY4436396.1 hypothetical protein [Cronobacter sakazakii]
MSWAKLRNIQITPIQALKLAQGGEVTALDTRYRANHLTGELIVTGSDVSWRKTIALHQAKILIARWKRLLQ